MTADEVADLLNRRELLWDRKGPTPEVSAAQVAVWHQVLADVPNAHMAEALAVLARSVDGWPPSIARICETRRMLQDRADETELVGALKAGNEELVPPEVGLAMVRELRDRLHGAA